MKTPGERIVACEFEERRKYCTTNPFRVRIKKTILMYGRGIPTAVRKRY